MALAEGPGSAYLSKVIMSLCVVDLAKVQHLWIFRSILFSRYVNCFKIVLVANSKRMVVYRENEWHYDINKVDIRSGETRTKEELCKNINNIMDFLEFSAESEDFHIDIGPTLDIQIKVRPSMNLT